MSTSLTGVVSSPRAAHELLDPLQLKGELAALQVGDETVAGASKASQINLQ